MERFNSPIINQMFVASAVLSTVLSCGLGLGYLAAVSDQSKTNDTIYEDNASYSYIESAGEIAFLPSIVIIPFTMQKKGRRIASLVTVLPLLFSWVISFGIRHFICHITFSILHNISLGGTVAISSVIISEFCSPKYRGVFLMLETAMISLGLLVSHLSAMFSFWRLISALGIVTAVFSLIVMYNCPESPYWLISQGYMLKGTDNFYLLRGRDEKEMKELEALLMLHKIKFQLKALKPIRKLDLRENIVYYLKSLLKSDFLKPLSIMILLFSFVGIGGENLPNYTFRGILNLTNGKYIGTIILDVLTLICSLTACVLIQIVRRKTLFLFTGSFAIIFLSLTSLVMFLQTLELFSKDYLWLSLTLVTGFVIFMSLGTTALPFSLLGEIFPMSYKGVGSSLTCAYLWALSNTIFKLIPLLMEKTGIHGILFIGVTLMITSLIILKYLLPETDTNTLIEIEQLIKSDNIGENYELVARNERADEPFDNLKLYIDV